MVSGYVELRGGGRCDALAGCCADGDGRRCCVRAGDACIGHEVVAGGAGVCNGCGESLGGWWATG